MDYESDIYNRFRGIIAGSVQYEIRGTVLVLTGYYTGKRIKLDLARISPEMLDEILADEDCEEGGDW